jgi:hypothetical protein
LSWVGVGACFLVHVSAALRHFIFAVTLAELRGRRTPTPPGLPGALRPLLWNGSLCGMRCGGLLSWVGVGACSLVRVCAVLRHPPWNFAVALADLRGRRLPRRPARPPLCGHFFGLVCACGLFGLLRGGAAIAPARPRGSGCLCHGGIPLRLCRLLLKRWLLACCGPRSPSCGSSATGRPSSSYRRHRRRRTSTSALGARAVAPQPAPAAALTVLPAGVSLKTE